MFLAKQLKLILAFSSMFFLTFCKNTSYEEPKYEVLKEAEGNIEIRNYPSLILAEVKGTGEDREKVMNGSFRILFKYITGNNEGEQEIKMTIPVFQEQTDSQEWSMSFIMPSKWTLEEIPQPKNEKIKIKKLNQQKMAALRFSGWGTQKTFSEKKALLENYLSKNQISYNKDKPIYAYYNSPWTLWFLRRNEVLFQLL